MPDFHLPTPANGKPSAENSSPHDDKEQERKAWAQVGAYAELAFLFPIATVVGWLIGTGLDRWLHTTWLYLVGLILGIAAGFVELIRTVSRNT